MWVRFLHAGPNTMQVTRTKQKYLVKPNVTLTNKLSNEKIVCDIVDETEIEGRPFWVVNQRNRPDSRLLMAKDSYSVSKIK